MDAVTQRGVDFTAASPTPLHVVVTGSHGFVGRNLVRSLEQQGHRVTRLVRGVAKDDGEVQWNPNERQLDPAAIDGADVIVNLAGSLLARFPWTYIIKRDILRSRINSTLTVTAAMAKAKNPPPVLINGSIIWAYGSRPGETITEASSLPGEEGYLPRLADRWERAAATAPAGTRVVMLRSGLILGRGGAVTVFRILANMGLLGQLETGEQVWPWISIRDEVRAIEHLMTHDVSGPVNLVGPTSATANELLGYLASELKRPFVLKTPASFVGFTMREGGRELYLSDIRAEPRKLLDSGFVFKDRTVADAVDQALKTPVDPEGEQV